MPLKEFIRFLDEGLPAAERFIIQDVDDTHLFVRAEAVDFIQTRVKE